MLFFDLSAFFSALDSSSPEAALVVVALPFSFLLEGEVEALEESASVLLLLFAEGVAVAEPVDVLAAGLIAEAALLPAAVADGFAVALAAAEAAGDAIGFVVAIGEALGRALAVAVAEAEGAGETLAAGLAEALGAMDAVG